MVSGRKEINAIQEKSIIWFRHGLRLHDNPALLEAISTINHQSIIFYPIFIFDNETADTNLISYNRMKFLIESLADLDTQFKQHGGHGLYIFRGNPLTIFKRLWEELGITKLCYEQDCEPIWDERDIGVVNMCRDLGIKTHEKISHTLWDPLEVIATNGNYPPLTYQMFLHTINVLGPPNEPNNNKVIFSNICFGKIPESVCDELKMLRTIPSPEDFDIFCEHPDAKIYLKWKGGETEALKSLTLRLNVEKQAFENGTYLPNQANPNLLGSSTSMSAALRLGCLSVRLFYHSIHNSFKQIQEKMIYKFPGGHHITGQLIWREYFYTMSVKNPFYARMKNNPICLNINWNTPNPEYVTKWKNGQTGFPIVDAAMRQLLIEGWLHHVLRNIVATFLTRTGLWYNWEIGVDHFLKYLLDADWSVNAGNWMWVSSSAFEQLLDSSKCSIIPLAKRMDPNGEYVKRYIPELQNFPKKYIHEPWTAPVEVQEECGCIVGQNYPQPIIDLENASRINCNRMKTIRETLTASAETTHIRPSNDDEIRNFFWIADEVAVN